MEMQDISVLNALVFFFETLARINGRLRWVVAFAQNK